MKKLLLTALAAVSIQAASAQNSAVNSAALNHKNGTLDKAKESIDKAIAHPKTKEKAKTWFIHGIVHQDMIGNPVYGKMADDKTPELVLQSFEKTVEIDGKNGEFGKQVPDRLNLLYGQVLNQAVEFHNTQDWDNAIRKYDLASKIDPTDTTAVIYSAYASIGKEDYASAIKYYDKLINMGHNTQNVYRTKIQLLQQTEAPDDQVMTALSAALKEHPNDVYLMQEELRYFLKADRGDEALAKLEKAIAADPNNASLHAVLGNLQERKNNLEGATKSYRRALEIDPNSFDANYNLAVLEYNKGSEVNNKAAKMDYKTYQKQGAALEAQAKKHFEASLPYFEKAHQIQPDDQATLQNLNRVYTRLNRTKDAERISKLMGN